MNYKIIWLIVFVHSMVIFSAADTKKSLTSYQARSETPGGHQIDEILSYIPGYGYIPGVASLIGEPVKEIALLGEGIKDLIEREPGASGKLASITGREVTGLVGARLVYAPNMSIPQLGAYFLSGMILPSNAVLRSAQALLYVSAVFNRQFQESLYHKDSWMTAMLKGITAATYWLGIHAVDNWVSSKARQYVNRINSHTLQKSYYMKGDDEYNKKIDTIFEQNPILFTLFKDADRKLLIAAKLAEMENPHVFDNLQVDQQQSQVQKVAQDEDKKSLSTVKMDTKNKSVSIKKRNSKRK